MIDFDKMTVAEHEEYKEMQRKAKGFDEINNLISSKETHVMMESLEGIVSIVSKYESGD